MLGKNSIGDQGCQVLMKSKWPSLEQIHLCTNNITQHRIISVMMDAHILYKLVGRY